MDTVFWAPADARRRRVLRYVRTFDGVASVDDLVDYLRERERPTGDRRRIEVGLHHATLPQLARAGLIAYDDRARTVEDLPTPLLDRVWSHAVEVGVAP